MAIGGLFDIGRSGLSAFQNALDTTGNNITNIYSEGYARQGVSMAERKGAINGNGVDFSHNQRIIDGFVEANLRTSTTNYNGVSSYYDQALKLDAFLGSESGSVTASLDNFFSALHTNLSATTSIPARLALMDKARTLVNSLQTVDAEIDNQQQQLNQSLVTMVCQINNYTEQLADINKMLQHSTSPPNNLLDERDQILRKLSELIPINSTTVDNRVDVYLQSGDGLVTGINHLNLVVKDNPDGSDTKELYTSSRGHDTKITESIHSAKLGGIINFQREILEPAKNEINHFAMVLSDTINIQHQKGLDLNSNYGGLFYTDVNSEYLVNHRVAADGNNSGNASFQVMIDQTSQTKPSEYLMRVDSPTTYSIFRKADNTEILAGTLNKIPAEIKFDGLTLSLTSGQLITGDRYIINPTAAVIRQMEVKLGGPEDIALAAPISTIANRGNSGNGHIQYESIVDISNQSFSSPNKLEPPIQIVFLTATSYQICNAITSEVIESPISYDPTAGAELFPTPANFDPGYRVKLTGNIHANDKFDILFNDRATGDNRNGNQLAALQMQATIGGVSNFQDGYTNFLSKISSRTHSADLQHQSAKILLDSAQARRNEISGVNLDEEAAMLLQFQKSYQASAQLITVADSIFETIIRLAG